MLWRGLFSNSQNSNVATSTVLFILFLATGLTSVIAEDANPKSQFLFPNIEHLPVYTDDTILVSYISSFPSPGLFLWCDKAEGGPYNAWAKEPSDPFNATVPVLLNFTSEKPCWFNLRRLFESPDGANSEAISIIGTQRPKGPLTISGPVGSPTQSPTLTSSSVSTTLSTSTSTSTSSSRTASKETASTGTPPNNAASSTVNDSGGSGISAGVAAGIGVGVGVIVLGAFAAIIIWLRRWRGKIISEVTKAGGGTSSEYGNLDNTEVKDSTIADRLDCTSPFYVSPLTPPVWVNGPGSAGAVEMEVPGSAVERRTAEMATENYTAEISTSDSPGGGHPVRQERYA